MVLYLQTQPHSSIEFELFDFVERKLISSVETGLIRDCIKPRRVHHIRWKHYQKVIKSDVLIIFRACLFV